MTEIMIFVIGTVIGMIYLCSMNEIDNFIKKSFRKVENKVEDLEKEKWLM